MADPMIADLQRWWHEYCRGEGSSDPAHFTTLFTESVDGSRLTLDELQELLSTFPAAGQVAEGVERCVRRRWEGPIAAPDHELVGLAEAHRVAMIDYARVVGVPSVVELLGGVSQVVVQSPEEFDADPFREDPADLFMDTHWDGVNAALYRPGAVEGIPGLKEACWGVAGDRYVCLHVLDPVVGGRFGFDHYFELWRRGSATAVDDNVIRVRGNRSAVVRSG